MNRTLAFCLSVGAGFLESCSSDTESYDPQIAAPQETGTAVYEPEWLREARRGSFLASCSSASECPDGLTCEKSSEHWFEKRCTKQCALQEDCTALSDAAFCDQAVSLCKMRCSADDGLYCPHGLGFCELGICSDSCPQLFENDDCTLEVEPPP